MRKALAALAAAMLLAGCGDGTQQVDSQQFADICAGLEGNLPVQRRAALDDLLELAADDEGSGDIIGAVRERCPDALTDALTASLGGGGDDGSAELRRGVDAELDSCKSREAVGTVTNTNDTAVSVRILGEFYDADDVLLHSSWDSIPRVRPGESARFSVSYFGDSYDRCRVEIEQVDTAR